jgi:uncharacterized protein YndB with AHSA1/START domain
MSELLTIRLDRFLPYSPATVWEALTNPAVLGQWLMPNDFKLEVGHHFTFQTGAISATKFGGTVYGEVLEFEPERFLRYRWADGGDENGLNSTVSWRLEPEGEGTHLYLEQAGFDPDNPFQKLGHQMMSGGWPNILNRLETVLGTL